MKKKLIIISLTGHNYSQKKMSEILDRLNVLNTLVVFVYPHPSVKIYRNEKKLEQYFLTKKNDFKILKNFNNLILIDPFKKICSDCSLDEYKQLFTDNTHFTLSSSLSLKELFRKVNF